MQNAQAMRIESTFQRLRGQLVKILQVQRPSLNYIRQRLPLQEFHDDEHAFIIAAEIVNGDDVRMLQGGQ